MQSVARPSLRPVAQSGLLVMSGISVAVALGLLGAMIWDRSENARDLAMAAKIRRDAIPRLTIAHVIPADGDAFDLRLAGVSQPLLHCLPFEGVHRADDARPLRAGRRLLTPGPAFELMVAADAACRAASQMRRQLGASA